MSAIDVQGLRKMFGTFTAVDGATFTVEAGEVVGLLGANGAGKTTVMRMILGLLAPTGGRVLLFGARPSRATRARIGYVPQGLGLYRDLTIAENLAFAAGAYGGRPGPLPPDLAAVADTRLDATPLGIRRRAAFAAMLQHRPELLVLDEPTSGVDPLSRARLWDRIRAEAEQGSAALVSTHYMDEARQADRLLLMAGGRVVGRGTEREIVGEATAVVVDGADPAAILRHLDREGFVVMPAGGRLRIPGGDPARIRAGLDRQGIAATVSVEVATLEEAMAMAEPAGRTA